MKTLLLTLMITFPLLLIAIVHMSYCKRRQRKTSHGLTGMCHESGGEMCGCCSSALLAEKNIITPKSCKKTTD